MGETFSNKNQIQGLFKNVPTSKSEEFYSKETEELPDKWRQDIANNDIIYN